MIKYKVKEKIHNEINIDDIASNFEFIKSEVLNEKVVRLKFSVNNKNYYTAFYKDDDSRINLFIDKYFECIE